MRDFKMVLFTASCRNTFVGGTLPSALLVVLITVFILLCICADTAVLLLC